MDEAVARSAPVVKPKNVAAIIAVSSAVIGFWIIPIVLAPVAIIAGFIGRHDADGKLNVGAVIAPPIGMIEIWLIVHAWQQAGVF